MARERSPARPTSPPPARRRDAGMPRRARSAHGPGRRRVRSASASTHAPSSPGRNGRRASDSADSAAARAWSSSPAASASSASCAPLCGCEQVDPRSLGQVEPVAAERGRQSADPVDRLRRRPRSLLAITVNAFSQVAGGDSPQIASASSSRGTGRLRLGDEVGEQQPTLTPREARLVDHAPFASAATRPVRNTFSRNDLATV